MRNQKPLGRRLAAWVLSIAMVLTMLPGSALAVTIAPVVIGGDGEAVIAPQPDETDPHGDTEETEALEESQNPSQTEESGELEQTEESDDSVPVDTGIAPYSISQYSTYVQIELAGADDGNTLILHDGKCIANNDSTTVTDGGSGVAWYKDGVLTLNGINAKYIYCVFSNQPLKIVLQGQNEITGYVTKLKGINGSIDSSRPPTSIFTRGDTTISGSGTLSINTTHTGQNIPDSYYAGIYCDSGKLTLDNTNVTIRMTNNITGGRANTYGVMAYNGLAVNGGSLSVSVFSQRQTTCYGAYVEGGELLLNGGTHSFYAQSASSEGVTNKYTYALADDGNNKSDESLINNGNITIKNGAVVTVGPAATAGGNPAYSTDPLPYYGIYSGGYSTNGVIAIGGSGRQVQIAAHPAGYAVYAGSYNVSNSADNDVPNIVIKDGANLKATTCGVGLYSLRKGVLIDRSPVDITAGMHAIDVKGKSNEPNASSYGLRIFGNSVVNLTGGDASGNASNNYTVNTTYSVSGTGSVSVINLEEGGHVTMKLLMQNPDSNQWYYALHGWVKLGAATAVEGAKIDTTAATHGEESAAKVYTGRELTFTYDADPISLDVTKVEGGTTTNRYQSDILYFEVGKTTYYDFVISGTGTSTTWNSISGLPSGITAGARSDNPYVYRIGGTPSVATTAPQTITVSGNAKGRDFSYDYKLVVQPASADGKISIKEGSTNYNFSLNDNVTGWNGYWNWNGTDHTLTLNHGVLLNSISMTGGRTSDGELIPLNIVLNGTATIDFTATSNGTSAISSPTGVNITGNGTLTIKVNGGSCSYINGINCWDGNNLLKDGETNDITIGENATVYFEVTTDKEATAMSTNNGDVNIYGKVDLYGFSENSTADAPTGNITGANVFADHAVNIGDSTSSQACFYSAVYSVISKYTAINAGEVYINTTAGHTAISFDDEMNANMVCGIKLLSQDAGGTESGGLKVENGRVYLIGRNASVISGYGPIALEDGAELSVNMNTGDYTAIFLEGDNSNVTVAPGGKLEVDYDTRYATLRDGISTQGSLTIGAKDSTIQATLTVKTDNGYAVRANSGVFIYGNSAVNLTNSANVAAVYTYPEPGSIVDLAVSGSVTVKGANGNGERRVWDGPIKLGGNTTCTGVPNEVNAPEGYAWYYIDGDTASSEMKLLYAASHTVRINVAQPNDVAVSINGVKQPLELKTDTAGKTYYEFTATTGANVELIATAGEGYRFANWGDASKTDNPYTITGRDSYITLTPKFELMPTTLVLTVTNPFSSPYNPGGKEITASVTGATVEVEKDWFTCTNDTVADETAWTKYTSTNYDFEKEIYVCRTDINPGSSSEDLSAIKTIIVKLGGYDTGMPVAEGNWKRIGNKIQVDLYFVCNVSFTIPALYEGEKLHTTLETGCPLLYTATAKWETEKVNATTTLFEEVIFERRDGVCVFTSENSTPKATLNYTGQLTDGSYGVKSTELSLGSAYRGGIAVTRCDRLGLSTVPIPAGVTVSGTVTSYGDAAEKVTVTLLQGETSVGTWSGTTGPYTLSNVAPGTYTLRVEKKGHATFTKEITVTDSNVTENVAIYQLGDVNMSGDVTVLDANQIRKYCVGGRTFNEYQLLLADVNGSGDVTVLDANQVRQRLVGIRDEYYKKIK